ncbi:MAG: peptide deformylase [Candidatus Nomurabacteria bacterium]|nr:peptide deformylase [Candidatus Nomurabacteria bacterium]
MKKIVQKSDRVLRQNTKEIPVSEITTPKIKKILKEMSEALKSQSDGVAIAAPQIGYKLSIFVVSGKIFHKDFGKERPDLKSSKRSDLVSKDIPKDLIFINPKISKLSKEKEWLPEGCLSVRWLYGKTFRSKKAMVTAYDEKGKKFQRGASGLLAQIFQHETDHLKGVLFIDHAKDIKEELPK